MDIESKGQDQLWYREACLAKMMVGRYDLSQSTTGFQLKQLRFVFTRQLLMSCLALIEGFVTGLSVQTVSLGFLRPSCPDCRKRRVISSFTVRFM